MTTRVRIHKDGAITVHQTPSWLERLFRVRPRDLEVEWNGCWYVGADDGKPVSWRENEAIAKAVGR